MGTVVLLAGVWRKVERAVGCGVWSGALSSGDRRDLVGGRWRGGLSVAGRHETETGDGRVGGQEER